MSTTYYSVMDCAVGPLTLAWSGAALVGVSFGDRGARAARSGWRRDDACLSPVRAQLEQYFRGERERFELPFAFTGTPFQERVWRALEVIPFGGTTSYGDLAARIGEPKGPGARGV